MPRDKEKPEVGKMLSGTASASLGVGLFCTLIAASIGYFKSDDFGAGIFVGALVYVMAVMIYAMIFGDEA